MPTFFESLARLNFPTFNPHTFFEDGNRVMALVQLEIEQKTTGKRYSVPCKCLHSSSSARR